MVGFNPKDTPDVPLDPETVMGMFVAAARATGETRTCTNLLGYLYDLVHATGFENVANIVLLMAKTMYTGHGKAGCDPRGMVGMAQDDHDGAVMLLANKAMTLEQACQLLQRAGAAEQSEVAELKALFDAPAAPAEAPHRKDTP